MKKPIILSILFVVIAVGIIWGGAYYSTQMEQASQQVETQQNAAAQQTQTQAMQNLKVEDIKVGTGTVAAAGDKVTVNYTGTLDDGSKFDSSYDRNQPFTFLLGAGQVIQGWDVGVAGMKVGGKRQLTIPPEMGYGPGGHPPVIPPNATLHFTVELLAVSTSSGQ